MRKTQHRKQKIEHHVSH